MERLEIDERRDVSGGVSTASFVGAFFFPTQFNYRIEFVPPRGAKPAADLPPRVTIPQGGG
jgi:hypothetical protein